MQKKGLTACWVLSQNHENFLHFTFDKHKITFYVAVYLHAIICFVKAQVLMMYFTTMTFCCHNDLLCTSCSIRIVTYITYLNIYIILTIIEHYTTIKCVTMMVWPIVAEKVTC